MIFKVYGKTNNKFSRDICDATIIKLKKLAPEAEVKFYDMDTEEGIKEAYSENVYYIPTILCEDEYENEIGYVENMFALGGESMLADMNKCNEWWSEIEQFVKDMFEFVR